MQQQVSNPTAYQIGRIGGGIVAGAAMGSATAGSAGTFAGGTTGGANGGVLAFAGVGTASMAYEGTMALVGGVTVTEGGVIGGMLGGVAAIIGSSGKGDGGAGDNTPKETYNSIKNSPKYPEDFKARQNGTKKYNVNAENKDFLRKIESGEWKKVYKDGYNSSGDKVSIHYFESQSGKVFDVKVKPGWSNP